MSAITENVHGEQDPHFEPVIKLIHQVEVKTNEEDEEQMYHARAKLFRLVEKEWKEKGTGDVRLLQHKVSKKNRLLMRRDKVLKVCANHLITPDMVLKPNVSSDRSWVWKVAADYSEDPPTDLTLAIRFANPEIAHAFKEAFEKAREANINLESPKSIPPKESEPKKSEPAPKPEPNPAEAEEEEKVEAEEEGKVEAEEEGKVKTEEEAKEETKE